MKYLKRTTLALLALAGCAGEEAVTPNFQETGFPETLSSWGQVHISNNKLTLSEGVTPYDINTPLFTDYAHKLRTVWLPDGSVANYKENDTFDFPVGTVITKTFYYPQEEGATRDEVIRDAEIEGLPENALYLNNVRLVETRILAHRKEGWVALPYVWNEDQSEAVLMRAGDVQMLDLKGEKKFAYIVPDANQCAGCHATNNTTRAIEPIGPKARHINKDYAYPTGKKNQIDHWVSTGLLQNVPTEKNNIPQNAVWSDKSASLESRAKAYLDANCSHCHNPVGAADTSGLYLEATAELGPNYGFCKPPIAAGTGSGGRTFDIVPGEPENSIFTYRIESDNPAVMMPELGRSLVHKEGAALISEWIANLEGGCVG